MSTTLANLVADLKFWGAVQASEGFTDPGDFNAIVQRAVAGHNPTYSATSNSCNIPDREAGVVGLLSLHFLALLRAQKHSNAQAMRIADFQAYTKDTPFEKNRTLAEDYLAKYTAQCTLLGLGQYYGSKSVRVSEVTAYSAEIGAGVPVDVAEEPPSVDLAAPANPVGGAIVLQFAAQTFSEFGARYILHAVGSEPILALWNTTSSAAPVRGTSDTSELLLKTNDQRKMQFKVVLADAELVPGTVHRFLIVTETASGIFGYSNEVTLTISA